VLKFLKRVSRCYVGGFDAECVVFCRATIENALNDKFRIKEIPIPKPQNGKSEMRTKIDAAYKFGWFFGVVEKSDYPWKIWLLGNKAVHHDPEAVKSVAATVNMTMLALANLYDAK
jgi:hypothetical protein